MSQTSRHSDGERGGRGREGERKEGRKGGKERERQRERKIEAKRHRGIKKGDGRRE